MHRPGEAVLREGFRKAGGILPVTFGIGANTPGLDTVFDI